MKKIIALLTSAVILLTLTACGGTVTPATTPAVTPQNGDNATVVEYVPVSIEYEDDDLDESTAGSGMVYIILEGDTITLEGDGAIIEGTTATITSAGLYSISGKLNDGQILVNTREAGTVRLILNGADIACSDSAPIYVMNAEKTVITLADGTENVITDGASYVFEDEESGEPNAAIFAKSDLTINGTGSLTVSANYNNGIQSKDDLKITGGNITVNAANDAIKGKDSLVVRDGTITVTAGSDGVQSSNGGDAEKGFVAIEGGTLIITSGEDAIQAETNVLITGGDITITSGGGSVNSSSQETWGDWGPQDRPGAMENTADNGDDTPSAKGIKATVDITITGGTINIDSSDDSIHANSSLAIDGGNIDLSSGDDGIHADTILEINGGNIDIAKCYEGIESAEVTVNGGTIHLVSRDDGINVAGGADGSSIDGRPGQNNFNPADGDSGSNNLYINGGSIYIEATGDGLDANSSITMTAGTVIVNGPTGDGNGSMDYMGTCRVTGGFLITAGSSGMAQAPGTSSTQYSVMITFTSAQAAGTMVHIETEDGEDILTFSPTLAYQTVVLCSPQLANGVTYEVYTGGSSTGTATDGLYSRGTYTAGTPAMSFTISGMVTTAGSTPGGMGGMPGGDMVPRGRR